MEITRFTASSANCSPATHSFPMAFHEAVKGIDIAFTELRNFALLDAYASFVRYTLLTRNHGYREGILQSIASVIPECDIETQMRSLGLIAHN